MGTLRLVKSEQTVKCQDSFDTLQITGGPLKLESARLEYIGLKDGKAETYFVYLLLISANQAPGGYFQI